MQPCQRIPLCQKAHPFLRFGALEKQPAQLHADVYDMPMKALRLDWIFRIEGKNALDSSVCAFDGVDQTAL